MEEILAKFEDVRKDPYKYLSEWKERTGKKVIGCYPMWIPEEIIHAAGMLPVQIWEGKEPITASLNYVRPFHCALTRSFVEDVVTGKLDFMDGMVFTGTCNQSRGLPYVLHKVVGPAYREYIHQPAFITSPTSRDYLIMEYEKFRTRMGKSGGKNISNETINESIRIYNKNRSLLRSVYELRRAKPGLLKLREAIDIVHSSMLMSKKEHSQLLERLIPELEKREGAPDGKVKVFLTGHLCHAPRTDVLDLIEEAGAMVVDDELFTGYRYFANDVEEGKDPIQSLADYFLKRTPYCPIKVDWETDWGDCIKDAVARCGAQGVLSLMPKYCPPHLCLYPDAKRRVANAGIPEVMIETEHEAVSLEAIKTRLGAFVEIIKAGGQNGRA